MGPSLGKYLTASYIAARLGQDFAANAAAAGLPADEVAGAGECFDSAGPLLAGVFLPQLFLHDEIMRPEISLLEEAAGEWATARELITTLARCRETLERLNKNPGPAVESIPDLRKTAADGESIIPVAEHYDPSLDAFTARAKTIDYIGPHPLSSVTRPDEWPWYEIAVARKTGLLVANIASAAAAQPPPSKAGKAFAAGALISHAANVAGADYLNAVVGGPRRLHRYRHRLAENVTETWIKTTHPDQVPGLPAIRDTLNALAADSNATAMVQQILEGALRSTYPECNTKPIPAFSTLLQRAVRHIELLLSFEDMPEPRLPAPSVQDQIDQKVPPDVDGPTGTTSSGLTTVSNPGTFDTPFKDSEWWEWLLLLLPLWREIIKKLLELWAWFRLAVGLDHPDDFRTDQDVQQLVSSPNYLELIKKLGEAEALLYESSASFKDALVRAGMLYPSEEDLNIDPFADLVGVNHEDRRFHTSYPEGERKWFIFPDTPVEEPSSPSYQRMGNDFDSIFAPGAGLPWTVGELATSLLIAAHRQEWAPSENMNLDADRHLGHLCWRMDSAPGDRPVVLTVLGFNEF